MVLEKKKWRCPICGTFHNTRYGAIWCCKCNKAEQKGNEPAYICEMCGKIFDCWWYAKEHEKTCFPASCRTCRHCEKNLRRYYPCPRPSFDKEQQACDYYERDRYHAAQAQA